MMFIRNTRSFLALMVIFCSMIFMIFSDAILSLNLEQMGVDDQYIGYVFALIAFCYAVTCPLVGIACKYVKRQYLTLTSLSLATVALLLYGPSEILNLPK